MIKGIIRWGNGDTAHCCECGRPMQWSQTTLRAACGSRRLYLHQCCSCGGYTDVTVGIYGKQPRAELLDHRQADLYAINKVLLDEDKCKVCHRRFDALEMEVIDRGLLIWTVGFTCPDCHTVFSELTFSPHVRVPHQDVTAPIENDAAF